MFSDSAFHDTYYVVAHVPWLLTLVLASLFVLISVAAVRRWSGSRLARRTGVAAVACWAIGLTAMLAVTLGWQAVGVPTLLDRPWIMTLLNETSSVAGFIMILAFALCIAMILVALWHRLFHFGR